MSIATALQQQHQGYAEALATDIAKKLPSHVEREELVGFAMVGLAEAAASFDVTRGVSFETFAYYRIRGAVFDGLRKMAWLPPRTRQTVVMQAGSDLVAEDAAGAAQGDLSQACRVLSQATRDIGAVFLASQLGDFDDDETTESAAAVCEHRESIDRLVGAVETLPQADQDLIKSLYVEQLSMGECGQMLGVNKATISRRHAKVISKLREALV